MSAIQIVLVIGGLAALLCCVGIFVGILRQDGDMQRRAAGGLFCTVIATVFDVIVLQWNGAIH